MSGCETVMNKKIYYHDTDCGGVVYYSNYLKYLEEARTEYFREKGADLNELNKKGIWFIVARVEIDYKIPAKYQDSLAVYTGIEKARAASMIFTQSVRRGHDVLVEAKTVLVCVDDNFKPIVIPDGLKELLLG